jgi:uncharacterized membrane protein
MELFLAQNHPAMTHLPIASALLAACAALTALFVRKKELSLFSAVLSIVALVTVLPAIVTGIAAARGRFNDDGKPYISSGVIVSDIPANERIFLHQIMGCTGAAVAAVLAAVGVSTLRGRQSNRYLVACLAVLLALLWSIGGHLGGKELWSRDTFPAFHVHQE